MRTRVDSSVPLKVANTHTLRAVTQRAGASLCWRASDFKRWLPVGGAGTPPSHPVARAVRRTDAEIRPTILGHASSWIFRLQRCRESIRAAAQDRQTDPPWRASRRLQGGSSPNLVQ